MELRQLVVGQSLARSLLRAGIVAAALLLLSRFALSPIRASGISMLPTVQDGDWLLLNRLVYHVVDPRRGDLVAITIPGERAVLVKRVVGLPGERVSIEAGVVTVDGQPLDEPYVELRRPWQVEAVTLAADEYYVVGDNRGMAPTNHDFGVTHRTAVLGRVR